VSLAPTPAAPVAVAQRPARAAPVVRRSDSLVPLRRLGLRVRDEWLPGATWMVGRAGRPGLAGIALLAASAVFLVSTQMPVASEVASLREQLASAQRHPAATRAARSAAAVDLRMLPARDAMPAVLGTLVKLAEDSSLTLDTGKYEASASRSGELVRYRVAFPVTGAYPQVRKFIDATLAALPAVAISDLSIERKTIGDGAVEAQIRLTVFTRSGS